MNFVKGMDLSTLAELEKCGAKYYDNGEEKDLLELSLIHISEPTRP